MSISPAAKAVTAEEFYSDYPDLRAELIEGEVVELPPENELNGFYAGILIDAIVLWNATHHAGRINVNSGFITSRNPDTVRAPDGAFFLNDRLARPIAHPYGETVPDLVIEVVSPSDRANRVWAKVGEWLQSGVRVLWVVWPDEQQVWVCRAEAERVVLSRTDTLTAEEVLPGFALPLEELFGAFE